MCKKCFMNINGNKNVIIECIINNSYSQDELSVKNYLDLQKMYIQLFDTEQFVSIWLQLNKYNIWYKYNDSQSKYFKDVSKIR